MIRKALFLSIVVAFVLSIPSPSFAKTQKLVEAQGKVLWSSLVRYVRVDLDMEIMDKDRDGGYLLFKYKASHGEKCRSAVEIIPFKPGEKAPAKSTKVQVSIPCTSGVQERIFLDGLNNKIKKENK